MRYSTQLIMAPTLVEGLRIADLETQVEQQRIALQVRIRMLLEQALLEQALEMEVLLLQRQELTINLSLEVVPKAKTN